MALTAATGLSATQQAVLNETYPGFRENSIPSAVATTADVDALTADLLSTASGKGASQVSIEDSGALITATTVEAALAEHRALINASTTEFAAIASTNVGVVKHVKITTAGGATANTDKALPTGTWEVIDCHVVNKAAGTTSDTIQLAKDTGGNITDAIDISGADKTIARAGEIDDANNTLIGGTDALRVVETDGGGSDSPSVDVHVSLRLVA